MVDLGITVDVFNLDNEGRMRVQDAFFELGIEWVFSGKRYVHLNKGYYTNLYKGHTVTNYLMFSDGELIPTHTPEELFELVKQIKHSKITSKEEDNMSKINLKPFNLEAALAGKPVVTRDGREVSQVTLFECSGEFPLIAVVNGGVYSFTKQGRHYNCGQPSSLDLFMKPKTHIVNGFEVPAPESEPLKVNDDYYFPDCISNKNYGVSTWYGDDFDKRLLKTGLVFLNKEDAIANAKAMLGIDPYKG